MVSGRDRRRTVVGAGIVDLGQAVVVAPARPRPISYRGGGVVVEDMRALRVKHREGPGPGRAAGGENTRRQPRSVPRVGGPTGLERTRWTTESQASGATPKAHARRLLHPKRRLPEPSANYGRTRNAARTTTTPPPRNEAAALSVSVSGNREDREAVLLSRAQAHVAAGRSRSLRSGAGTVERKDPPSAAGVRAGVMPPGSHPAPRITEMGERPQVRARAADAAPTCRGERVREVAARLSRVGDAVGRSCRAFEFEHLFGFLSVCLWARST